MSGDSIDTMLREAVEAHENSDRADGPMPTSAGSSDRPNEDDALSGSTFAADRLTDEPAGGDSFAVKPAASGSFTYEEVSGSFSSQPAGNEPFAGEPAKSEPFADEPVKSEPFASNSVGSRSYPDYASISSERLDFDLRGFDVVAGESAAQFMSEDGDYAQLPNPEVFNAYPPEVQRKIVEWTDRDVKARRDDESRRQDELMRAEVSRNRSKQVFPVLITVLALVCATITGIATGNPLFPLVFLLVPVALIAARIASDDSEEKERRNKPPRV